MKDKKQSKTSQKPITFKDFDKLDLKSFRDDLFQVIDKGLSSAIEDMGEKRGWTISLNANFGNGKTTFLKMFEHFMKTEKQKNYDVLFINAWESDFYKEPVIAILSEFANWLEQNKDKNKTIKIMEVIGIIGKNIGMNIVNQYLQLNTGGVVNLKDTLKDIKTPDIGKNLLSSFKQRKTVIDTVRNEIFSEYTKNSGKKLLIIIDELDRARPDYAVRFLEDIKHFFDIENVAFLVAANRTQMEATVKCLYGQDLDFDGYYRKFFKHEMDLPDPYKQIQKFIKNLIKETKIDESYFINEEKIDEINEITYVSCKMFQLTLREVEHFARIFEMVCKNNDTADRNINNFPFPICLYLKRKDVFEKMLKVDFTTVESLLEKNFKYIDEGKKKQITECIKFIQETKYTNILEMIKSCGTRYT